MKSTMLMLPIFSIALACGTNGDKNSSKGNSSVSTKGAMLTVDTLPAAELEDIIAKLKTQISAFAIDPDRAAGPDSSHVACAETTTVSQTHICIFNFRKAMNLAVNRASHFIEVDGTITDHSRHVSNRENSLVEGHDLKGADLTKYNRKYEAKRSTFVLPTSDEFTQEYTKAIQLEDDFWSLYLKPALAKQPDLVFLAVSLDSDIDATLDHEIRHAHYFKTTGVAEIVKKFFTSEVTKEHQNEIRDILSREYDVYINPSDSPKVQERKTDLLINEFQAYILMKGFENSKLAAYAPTYREKLMNLLLEAKVGK